MSKKTIERYALRVIRLAKNIKKGDHIKIGAPPLGKELALEIYRLLLLKGAHVILQPYFSEQSRIFYQNADNQQLDHFPESEYYQLKKIDLDIIIDAQEEIEPLKGIDPKKINRRKKALKKITQYSRNKVHYLVIQWPTPALAKLAKMPFPEYQQMVINAANINMTKLMAKMNKIKELMDKTDWVHVIGNRTDISFRIRNRPAYLADGSYNIPPGEVFTSIIENSTDGYIYFDNLNLYHGNLTRGVYLKFRDGMVIESKAKKNNKFLQEMLSVDEGAKRFGEFAFGCNHLITCLTPDILISEKMDGTIHFALGDSYDDNKGKNRSSIHWDLIKDLRNGGKIYFDDQLVYENGRFISLK